jgi:hypothetical protein
LLFSRYKPAARCIIGLFTELPGIEILGSWQHLAPALRGVDFIRQAQE